MYVQDMEKILAATYKNWKETEKIKILNKTTKVAHEKVFP